MDMTETPWGSWQILLETPEYKVKRLTVNSGHRLSYQKHAKRREHWTVVQGEALVTLNGEEANLGIGQSIDIPMGSAHRIANAGNTVLTFIEVQTGSYFGEDDIERLEDDYGRET